MALLKKAKSRGRGAVKKQSEKKQFRLPKINFKPLLLSVVCLALVAGLVRFYDVLADRPINRVMVEGNFEFVERDEITSKVQPLLADGFIFLDIDELRNELEVLPWVYQVAIERQWPDRLKINVVEQTVFARWSDKGYLNQDGELFLDRKRGELMQLPSLSGPDGSESLVVQQFSYLQARFSEKDMTLNRLSLSGSGLWTATLNDGLVIAFGDGDVSKKMDRLLTAFDASIGDRLAQVKSIDMRYSNGLAVRWDQAKAEL